MAARGDACCAASGKGTDFFLMLLRVAIGWHFLYEGVTKLLSPGWSAASYLTASTGPLSDYFHRMAADPKLLPVVNQLNMWGLTLVGACLMLGLCTRLAALGGMGLLALYYASSPPLFGPPGIGPQEGHYLIINKNLIEMVALVLVLFRPASFFGLDGLLGGCWRWFRGSSKAPAPPAREELISQGVSPTVGLPPSDSSRRWLLASLAGVPFVGGFALAALRRHRWLSPEERRLADAYSGATLKGNASKRIEDLKGKLPMGKIGKLEFSRMILGGNLIGGWAHARDLLYASDLVKAYNNRNKIFETFALAEACGVNTILTNPSLCGAINDYWRTTGGKIQFISDCGGKDVLGMVQKSIDAGACACYVQGGIADVLVEKGDFDTIAQALELTRKNGLLAGIGGHKLETIKACREKGLKPDFWMKTLHKGDYWSAFGGEEQKNFSKDNFWCAKPSDVISYMKTVPEPWIAFKILAAGAIHPRNAFRWAFESGADFICVGMYDFQLVGDVNIAYDVLNAKLKRQREWIA